MEQPGDSDAMKNVLALLRQMKEGNPPNDRELADSPKKAASLSKKADLDSTIIERRRLIEALLSDTTLSYRLASAKRIAVIALLGEAEKNIHHKKLIPESLMTIMLVHALLQGREITSQDEQRFIADVQQEAASRHITSDRMDEYTLHLLFQKHMLEFVGHEYVDMVDQKGSSQTEESLA